MAPLRWGHIMHNGEKSGEGHQHLGGSTQKADGHVTQQEEVGGDTGLVRNHHVSQEHSDRAMQDQARARAIEQQRQDAVITASHQAATQQRQPVPVAQAVHTEPIHSTDQVNAGAADTRTAEPGQIEARDVADHHVEQHVEKTAQEQVAEVHAKVAAVQGAAVSQQQEPQVQQGSISEQHDAPQIVAAPATGLYNMTVRDFSGTEVSLAQYAGKVTLVVNVASACGYTEKNYKGLTELYNKHRAQGFEVLAFPCNQFGSQEPGTCAEVKKWAHTMYNADFPIFDKVDVNGENAHPIFKFLKAQTPVNMGGNADIDWNFAKFMVNKKGFPVVRYGSDFDPEALEGWIGYELKQVVA